MTHLIIEDREETMEALLNAIELQFPGAMPGADGARDILKAFIATLEADRERAANSFQQRVDLWMQKCFGAEISKDTVERNHRFLEEALELVQSLGCTQSEAHQLVDYVFGRAVGDPKQEVGGVMVTLAALCLANGLDMDKAGETELARIWTKVEKIRAKQVAKPDHSPLPGYADRERAVGEDVVPDCKPDGSGLDDGPDLPMKTVRIWRDPLMKRLNDAGCTQAQIAKAFGVSRQSVNAACARAALAALKGDG